MPRFVASRHFRAFETLRSAGRDGEHGVSRVPYDRLWEARRVRSRDGEGGSSDLLGVQCEACHGPGTAHARDGSYAKAARESCRTCHTSKWSPDFDFQEYWSRAESLRAGG